MGLTREQKVIRDLSGKPTTQKFTPVATDMFLPNHSGIKSHPEFKDALGDYQAKDATLTSISALTDAAGVLTNDGAGGLSWAAGGGSQTPWTSDIDGDGYDLTGANLVEAINMRTDVFTTLRGVTDQDIVSFQAGDLTLSRLAGGGLTLFWDIRLYDGETDLFIEGTDLNDNVICLNDFHSKETIGDEMIANNSFDTDTLFTTLNGTIIWSAGSYTFNASAIKKQDFSDMSISPSAGVRKYKYEFYVSAYSGSTPIFSPIYPDVAVDITATGLYSGEVETELTDPFKFGGAGSGNSQIKIDYISVKEIKNGNIVADQDITANAFITEDGTSSQFVKGDGSLDSSTYLTNLATLTTDDLNQGSSNLYFSGGTLDTIADGSTYTKQMIADGSTAYGWGDWSLEGFITDLSSFTTDDLNEGSSNLYYTDGKVDSWLTNKGGYTGDLNDSTSTKIADVVDGLITAVYF